MRNHRFLLLVFLGLLPSTSLAQNAVPFESCPVAIDRSAKSAQSSTASVWASETEPYEGLVSVNYCGVFKRGKPTASRLAKDRLREVPSDLMPHQMYAESPNEKIRIDALPVGYSLYSDSVFEIWTDATPDVSYLVLRLPSVKTEEEFKRLRVLDLEEDIVVPGLLRWQQAAATDSDFATRRLRAEFDRISAFRHSSNVARIAVASFNSEVYEASALDLWIGSVIGPPYVRAGDEFTYKISFENGGSRQVIAKDVVFSCELGNAKFLSISSPQGRCGRSMHSTGTFICEFDSIPPGARTEITVTARARTFVPSEKLQELVLSSASEVMSREKDYAMENNRHISLSTIILPKSRQSQRKLH